ncbi:hypothetical protein [Streptomyces sp. NPDC047928]|uniref:hypothetical protein n=1 Tax=unclassified Streptomyces TaxID=2593676 RepID=UPI003722A212
MRTTARLLTGTALAVLALGVASPAYAGDFERLEVNPSTAAPGATVTVNTTACGPNGRGVGDAQSLGAGEFKLSPGTHKEVVVGQFRIPAHAKPGTYGIGVACDNGKTATGNVTVTHGGGPTDHHTPPSDHHTAPSGHVRTGVGGSVGPDTPQIAAGVAVLTAAAGAGLWLLRRRGA